MTKSPEQHLGSTPSISWETRRLDWPPSLKKQVEAALVIAEIARVDGYIDLYRLSQINTSERLLEGIGGWIALTRNRYERSIETWGQQALAHLCLPYTYQRELETRGVVMIVSLQSVRETGQASTILRLPGSRIQRICHVLAEWESLVIA